MTTYRLFEATAHPRWPDRNCPWHAARSGVVMPAAAANCCAAAGTCARPGVAGSASVSRASAVLPIPFMNDPCLAGKQRPDDAHRARRALEQLTARYQKASTRQRREFLGRQGVDDR